MPATIDTPPPDRALSKDPVWVIVETDDPISSPAKVVFTITSTGPTAGQTVRLQWAGYDITFTVAGSDSESAFDLPTIGADTLSVYADKFAERLRQNEVLHEYFTVSRGTAGSDETVTITQRTLAVVDITVTEDLSNVTAVATDVTEVTQGAGLRALLQVWQDTGDLSTDTLLLSLHAPYNLDTAQVAFDIRSAFAGLSPALPAASTIPSSLAPSSLATGDASSAYMAYYLRYADKAGVPAVSQALLKTDDSWLAVLGGLAGDSLHPVAPDPLESPLRHNYRRRVARIDFFTALSSSTLRKPIAIYQPDWVYVLLTNDDITGVYVSCHLYWSDGSESDYEPFSTTPVAVGINQVYWFPSGYRQMKLQTQSPPGGADPEAYIVAYDWALKSADLPGDGRIDDVRYRVHLLPGWDHYLLFSNGLGGCESVSLRGKAVEKYRSTAETYRRARTASWTVDTHEENKHVAEGQREWEYNTGWTDDADWIEHLRQLLLSDAVWLIDTDNRRFLAVTVQPGSVETKPDDDTLYQMSFTVRAGWLDAEVNV